MKAEEKQRLEAFEKMLAAVQQNYAAADGKMQQLKQDGKEKTVTFRENLGNKLMYGNMLSMYRLYGLIDRD